MAPGYAIALALETAGALGIVVALAVMRTERRARSAELRGYLRSGSSGTTVAPHARRPTARIADLPIASTRGTQPTGSTARAALHRVLAPRAVGPAVRRSLSAG